MVRRLASLTLTTLLCASVLSGCGGSEGGSAKVTRKSDNSIASGDNGDNGGDPQGQGDPIPDGSANSSGPTTEMVLVSDPVNNAFSVEVPSGWDNLVYSTVDGQIHHEVVNSVSPDGNTVVFDSDPKIPSYWNPDTANDVTRMFAEQLDTVDLSYYIPAPDYFSDYVTKKFGELAGFAITSAERDTATEQAATQAFLNAGLQPRAIDAVIVSFTFTDDAGKVTNALIKGVTIDSGDFWQAQISGVATTGSPADYLGMLKQISDSKKTNPDFTAAQNQRHEQIMAQIQANTEAMTRQHEANMAQIQNSANAHQQRMQAMWSANDASVSNFYSRMNSSDVQQRSFLNYINEENTVSTSGGKMQVDNSYQRYWVNKNDNTYVGGDINFGDSQIRGMGLNPSDYEEAQIIKG